jgi:hypothetical protein
LGAGDEHLDRVCQMLGIDVVVTTLDAQQVSLEEDVCVVQPAGGSNR